MTSIDHIYCECWTLIPLFASFLFACFVAGRQVPIHCFTLVCGQVIGLSGPRAATPSPGEENYESTCSSGLWAGCRHWCGLSKRDKYVLRTEENGGEQSKRWVRFAVSWDLLFLSNKVSPQLHTWYPNKKLPPEETIHYFWARGYTWERSTWMQDHVLRGSGSFPFIRVPQMPALSWDILKCVYKVCILCSAETTDVFVTQFAPASLDKNI